MRGFDNHGTSQILVCFPRVDLAEASENCVACSVAVGQSVQLAAVALGWATLQGSRGVDLGPMPYQLRLACETALLPLLVEQTRRRRGTATNPQSSHRDVPLVDADADLEAIARVERPGRLYTLLAFLKATPRRYWLCGKLTPKCSVTMCR